MLRKIDFLFTIICIVFFFLANQMVYAKNPNDRPLTLEECYIKMGYKSVEEAVKEFENHFKENVKLPSMKPPIPFTHQYGKFYEDKVDNTNDHLRIEFLNDKSPENDYEIVIRPLKMKLNFKYRDHYKEFVLQNGQKAIYMVKRYHSFLVFENKNWQYMFGVDARASGKVPPEVLLEIANSIE